jgi:hypothetical protein
MADRQADRHQVQAIPFRPETEEERSWLVLHAAASARAVVDVLRQAVREYRERVEER